MTEDTRQPCSLLVDDDHDVLGANARYLRLNDYQVVVADSAEVALDRLKKEKIDVVVTDLRMPGMDGIAFAREARLIKPLLPVLFFSGYASVPDVVEAMKLGAVDFLEKPVDPENLLAKLSEVQATHRDAVALQRDAFDIADTAIPFKQRVLAYEKYLIESCFLQHDGRVACVLEALKINRRTLNEKMTRLGIQRKG